MSVNGRMFLSSHQPPDAEPLVDATAANLAWFCGELQPCTYEVHSSLPVRRAAHHPWFSYFFLAARAATSMSDEEGMALWLHPNTLFTKDAPRRLWQSLRATTSGSASLLLPALGAARHDGAWPAFVAILGNRSAARQALEHLNSFLPDLGRPYPAGARGDMQFGYCHDGARRASRIGAAGQMELFLSSTDPAVVASRRAVGPQPMTSRRECRPQGPTTLGVLFGIFRTGGAFRCRVPPPPLPLATC